MSSSLSTASLELDALFGSLDDPELRVWARSGEGVSARP